MPKQSIDYCAVHYLNQWYSQDKRYVDMLQHGNPSDPYEQYSLLKEAATFYDVARCFPGNDKKDPDRERYSPILRALMASKRMNFALNTITKIEKVEQHIFDSTDGVKRVMSFTTKMLWLTHQDEILIYDSLARLALEIPNADVGEFHMKWRKEYKRKEGAIYTACQRLPSRHAQVYNDGRTSRADIEDLIQYQWFHERVFDIYLWFKGGAIRKEKDRDKRARRLQRGS